MFDSLGVVVEDGKGLVVVAGQKAELTRISDTNGDGIADKYETLFDAHSYHGNYHTYLHGPVRGEGWRLLLRAEPRAWRRHCTWAAARSWARSAASTAGPSASQPDGKGGPFANGLRSPASVGAGPDGRVWYADNQGDFVGTSKLFVLKKDKFYGHPAGLVDLPGMTPDSPEIKYDVVGRQTRKGRRAVPAQQGGELAGQSRVGHAGESSVRSPGQMLIGDQTQSNLLRVITQKVGEQEQGSVMPFFEGLESGVMRPGVPRRRQLVVRPDRPRLAGQGRQGREPAARALGRQDRGAGDCRDGGHAEGFHASI